MRTMSRCPLSDGRGRAGGYASARPSGLTLFDAVRHISSLEAAEKAGLDLKRRGDRAWTRCPLHGEKTASLCLYEAPARGWVCFGCHKGGDAVTLYSELYQLSKLDAARKLATDFGVPIPDVPRKGKRETPQPTIANLRRALEKRRAQDYDRLCRAHHAANGICEQYHDDSAWDDPRFVDALRARSTAEPLLDFLQRASVPELAEYYRDEVTHI